MRKKSTKVKKIQGSYQKCREKKNEMKAKPLDKRPKPPEFLSKIGKKCWNETIELLENQKMLHLIDLPSLTAYVFNVQVSYTLPAEIMKEGVITEYTNKAKETNFVKNPKLAVYNEALKMLNLFGSKFGFDPISRAKIDIPENLDENPFRKMRNEIREKNRFEGF